MIFYFAMGWLPSTLVLNFLPVAVAMGLVSAVILWCNADITPTTESQAEHIRRLRAKAFAARYAKWNHPNYWEEPY